LISLDLSLASLGCSIGLLALLGDSGLGVLATSSVLVALLLDVARNAAELARHVRLDVARNAAELARHVRLDHCVSSMKCSIGGAEKGAANRIALSLLDLEGHFNLRPPELLLVHQQQHKVTIVIAREGPKHCHKL
jgi:hypothetical protein